MSSLKMYNWQPAPRGLALPEGFSLARYTSEADIADWLWICRDGLIGEECGEEKFYRELVELDGPDPHRDTYFIVDDATGQKIATFTVVPNMWSTGMGYIHMVACRHEYRGRGLGRYIADHCLAELVAMGKQKIFLLTGDTRFAALATYLKAGFLPVNYVDERGFDMVDRWQSILDTLGLASLQLLNEDGTPAKLLTPSRKIVVTDAPYGARGDGVTNDRAAIQQAIDDLAAQGGGLVELPAGKTFLSGSLVLRSNIHFHFGVGAVLQQSADRDDYVKPVGNGYEPYRPAYGHNINDTVKWSHLWYYNYPMLFAGEGTRHVKISGHGTIRMMDVVDPERIMKLCPVAFYRVSDFTVSDVTITNYHSYAMMPFTSDHGLIKNVKINNSSYGNGDGICLMNCKNIRVSGCEMDTGDDSLYIFSSYKDPRHSEWWSSDEPQPSLNIEVDHNDLKSNHCKAFGMILWGIECPEQEKIEVRNVYVHDNHFQTVGNWNYNPYTTKPGHPPVTTFRFENNEIDAFEPNFFETAISDMNGYPSMRAIENGDFASGRVFWAERRNAHADSVGVGAEVTDRPGERFTDDGHDGTAYGYIAHLEAGDAALYQGLYLREGAPCTLWATVKTSGAACRLFVRDLDTQELVASQEFANTDWQDVALEFTVPAAGNYHVGMERGNATEGWAWMRRAVLIGNCEGMRGFARVGMDPQRRGKQLYFYDPDLWKSGK